MIPAKYRPRHLPDCGCAVCWTNQFHAEITRRNEARAERCRQIIADPRVAVPRQSSMFTLFDEVTQ